MDMFLDGILPALIVAYIVINFLVAFATAR